jgi:hypothetical protein
MAVIFVISYNVTLLDRVKTHKLPSGPKKVIRKKLKKKWPVYGEKESIKEEQPKIDMKNDNIGKGGVPGR